MSLTARSTEQERTLTQQEIGHQVASFSNREKAAAFAQAVSGAVRPHIVRQTGPTHLPSVVFAKDEDGVGAVIVGSKTLPQQCFESQQF